MGRQDKILQSVLSGRQDRNILFADLRSILSGLGFDCRIKGDHYIYTRNGLEEIVNIQPVGNKAKPYQVKQVREIILHHHLGGDFDV